MASAERTLDTYPNRNNPRCFSAEALLCNGPLRREKRAKAAKKCSTALRVVGRNVEPTAGNSVGSLPIGRAIAAATGVPIACACSFSRRRRTVRVSEVRKTWRSVAPHARRADYSGRAALSHRQAACRAWKRHHRCCAWGNTRAIAVTEASQPSVMITVG